MSFKKTLTSLFLAMVFVVPAYAAVPNSPSDFLARNYSINNVLLTWVDNASDEDNFNIYQATTTTQPGSPSYTPAANATRQAVFGLSTTLPNYFWLTAENIDGETTPLRICLRYSRVAGKLLACDGAASDSLGLRVALDGDTAVVSSTADDDTVATSGSAYVFEKFGTTWTQVAKLNASDPASNDQFGFPAVSGDTIVIAAPNDDDNGADSGSVYVFERPSTGWRNMTETAKLTPSDGAASDFFGYFLAISGDTIAVGSLLDDDSFSGSGSVYVFEKPGANWISGTETAKITASDPAASAQFSNVDIEGDKLVVGAFGDDDNGATSGSVYIYERPGGGWVTTSTHLAKITASDGAAGDAFGFSVNISGDTLVVGAIYDDAQKGSAYVYVEPGGGWVTTSTHDAKLTASDGVATDIFGGSVAIAGDTITVTATLDDDKGADAGAAYIFVEPGGGWVDATEDIKIVASDGGAGDSYGNAVSMTSGGTIIGSPNDDDVASNAGAAYSYVTAAGLPDSPSDFHATNFTGTTATLNWTDNSTDEVNFNIYYFTTAAQSGATYTPAANSESQAVTGLSSTLANYFWLTAQNANGETEALQICLKYSSTTGKLLACDGEASDSFSTHLAISGDIAVISSTGDDDIASNGGAAYVFQKNGSTWTQTAKLVQSDAVSSDGSSFGGVAIDGDTIAIGSAAHPTAGGIEGAVYVYAKPTTGWSGTMTENAKLTVPNTTSFEAFGSSVAVSGNTVFASANRETPTVPNDAGLIYVFERPGSAWADMSNATARLTASDAAASDSLGSISVSGDVVVGGADGDDIGVSNTGSAYVWVKPGGGWVDATQTAKLTASDLAADDAFGFSTAISGDVIVVGSVTDDDGATNAGSAYVFVKPGGGWADMTESAKLNSSGPATADQFGNAVAISGDYIYVGSRFDDDNGTDTGSVYYYLKPGGGWSGSLTQTAKLIASDGTSGDNWYGYSVFASGDNLLVSSHFDDDLGANAGAAYYYDRNDIITPAAPSGVYASNFTGTTATINWTDNSTNETGFRVYYSTTTTKPGSPAYTTAANATSQAATGLSNSLPNYFWVAARNSFGESTDQQICLRYFANVGKMLGCDTASGDTFGGNVRISGDYAIVGSRLDTHSFSQTGSAYIFYRSGTTWTEIKKLTASDPANFDNFGSSVAIDGDYAIVGAPEKNARRGAAYVFEKNFGGLDNWGEVEKLTDGAAANNDVFGSYVDISSTYAIVSAPGDVNAGTLTGSAFIYEKDQGGPDNWGEQIKLTGDGGASGAGFGNSVGITPTHAVVTAPFDNIGGSGRGSGFIFEKDFGGVDTWGQRQKVTPADAVDSQNFGGSSDIDGDYVIIGAQSTSPTGAAYIFKKDQGGADTWGQLKKFTPSDADTGDDVGHAVAISGTRAFVSAYADEVNGSSAGSAYVLEKDLGGTDNWGEARKIIAADADAGDLFAVSLSLSGSIGLIGAYADEAAGSNSGSAYGFDITSVPASATDFYATNFTGTTATLHWTDSVTGEANYNIYYSTSGPIQSGAPVYTPAANATSQAVTGLSTTLPNYFWLSAEDTALEGAPLRICLKYSSVMGKIIPCDGSSSDSFGYRVDIDGDTAVIGADQSAESGLGTAYIFKRSGSTWTEVAKLRASDAATSDFFGTSVAISGDAVVVGASGHDGFVSGGGSAYVYVKPANGWSGTMTENAQLIHSTAAVNDSFGFPVDISGDTIIVGAGGDDDFGATSGSVFVFVEPGGGWSGVLNEDAKLNGSDAAAGDFANYTAISGDTVVVGSSGDDDDGADSGSAYVYVEPGGGWTGNLNEDAKLTASDAAGDDGFGQQVAIDGGTIVVGAYGDDDNGSGSGSAYVFVMPGGGWSGSLNEDAKLLASDGAANDWFTFSVAVDGDQIMIGAAQNGDGAAYYFTEPGGGWTGTLNEDAKLVSSDSSSGDNFGSGVAVSGDDIIVGARYEDASGSDSGSAYYFDVNNLVPAVAPSDFVATNFTGTTATLTWTDNSIDENNFNIYYATTTTQPGSPAYTPATDATSQAVTGLSTTLPNYFWLTSENDFFESDPIQICLRHSSTSGKLLACDGAMFDYFGIAVSVDGDTAVVGARVFNAGAQRGAAYVFKKNGDTWTQTAKLTASDAADLDILGESVSISGNTIVVSAQGDDDNGSSSGSAYVFVEPVGGWYGNLTESAKLTASDGLAGDNFGGFVSIDGDTILVGAYLDDDNGDASGSAYVFVEPGGGWTGNLEEDAKLTPSDAAISDFFAGKGDISGDTIVLGAHGKADSGAFSGAAYVFVEPGGGWTGNLEEDAKLLASDAETQDTFGAHVSVDGDVIVVGAYGDDDVADGAGAAYVFVEPGGGWTGNLEEDAKLLASDGEVSSGAGVTAIDGDRIIIGANSHNTYTGKAYVYDMPLGGWSGTLYENIRLQPTDPQTDLQFAEEIGISGNNILLGAYYDDNENGDEAGSVYYFNGSAISVPNAPSDFLATDFSGTQADLSWTDNASDETAFNLYYNTSDVRPGSPSQVLAVDATSVSGVSTSATSPNFFWLTATGTFGESVAQKICIKYPSGVLGKLLACEVTGGGAVGESVSIYDEYAVVGNYTGGTGGAAYIFRRSGDTWSQIKTLQASDAASNDRFGRAVDIDQNYVAVGAPEDDNVAGSNAGAVYVFYKDQGGANNWGQVAKLASSDLGAGDFFGADTQISGDYLIAGAPYNDTDDTDAGAAYIFEKNTGGTNNWGQVARITSITPEADERFGQRVDIANDVAFVGSTPLFTGAVDAFYNNAGTWQNGDPITLSGGSVFIGATGTFDLAITDEWAAVRMQDQDHTGAVIYVLGRASNTQWNEVTTKVGYIGLGTSVGHDHVAINDEHIALAYDEDIVMFEKDLGGVDNWGELKTISAPDGEDLRTVSIYLDYILAGTDTDVNGIDDGGGAYFPGAAYALDWTGIGGGMGGTAGSKVFDAGAAGGAAFGFDVDIHNEWAIIADAGYIADSAESFIYKKNATTGDWELQQSLPAPSGVFNFSVAIDGNYAVAGMLNTADGFVGYADVYKRIADNDWQLVDTLTASDGAPTDSFGWTSALEGDYIVVGAPQLTLVGGGGVGKAYVFKRDTGLDTWSEIQTLSAPDAGASKQFAWNLDLKNEIALIGSQDLSGSGGSVYLYGASQGGPDNWGLVQQLSASDTAAGDLFGASVSIADSYLAVVNTDSNTETADLYIFKDNAGTWTETALIPFSEIYTGWNFSISLKRASVDLLDDSHVVVGIQWGEGDATDAGIAYVYERDTGLETWSLAETLVGGDGITGDLFGLEVAITGTADDYDIVVGAPQATGVAPLTGAAYFYNFAVGGGGGGGGGSGSTSGSPSPVCSVVTPTINLPSTLEVSNVAGQPTVELYWATTTVNDYTDDQVVQILMDYVKNNPGIELGDSGHDLISVMSKYFYDEIHASGNTGLIRDFEQTLDWIVRNYSVLAPDMGGLLQCSEHYSSKVFDALDRLLKTSDEKAELKNMLVKFADQLLEVERTLRSAGYRGGFNQYYSSQMSSNLNVSGDITLDIYRDGKWIHTQTDLSVTNFVDETLPPNTSGRTEQVKYYIKASTQCGSKNGSVGTASVDPNLPAGTMIDVDADISFRVKEGFDQLFGAKLTRLIEAARSNNITATGGQISSISPAYSSDSDLPLCAIARQKLDAGYPDSTTIMNYALSCLADDESTRESLQEQQRAIVPPILVALRLTQESNHAVVDAYIQKLIPEIAQELSRADSALSLATGNLARIDTAKGLATLTVEEKKLIICGGIANCGQSTRDAIEEYFAGSSHAADVTVEVYDSSNALVYSAEARSDIFGQIHDLDLGQFESAEEYTVKIRLQGQSYVLPKISKVTLNNAERTASGYHAEIELSYERHFRYGNFDDSDDVINRDDILEWGRLLEADPEIWSDANIDGLYGVDLLDVLTFQENWGEIQESRVDETQITLRELASLFGLTSSSDKKLSAPVWLDLLSVQCN